MDVLNSNLMDNANENLLNVKYFEKRYGAEGDTEAEAEGEKEYENEDNTEYESEESEIGDTSDTDLPKFRTLVRNKKLELKSQYGKAHIETSTVRKCTTIQVPKIRMIDKEVCVNVPYTHWDSNINCKEVCVKWNWKLECTERQNKCLGGFIGGTRQECNTVKVPEGYTEAEEVCVNVPRFKWVSGWRKQWREFKRNGGLAQLKLQSKGLYTPPSPQNTYTPQPIYFAPTPPPEPEFDEYQEWSCQDLSNEFGIIAGQTFGTAPQSAINSWVKRGCNTKPIVEETEPETTEEEVNETEETEEDTQDSKPKPRPKKRTSAKTGKVSTDGKILGMPKDIAIGLGIAVVLIGGFALFIKKG